VTPQVHHDPGPDHLPGQRGARRARDETEVVLVRERQQGPHIGLGPRQGDRDRELLVFRGIRGVQQPQRVAGVQFSLQGNGKLGEIGWRGHGHRTGT
jgi:hypothetical protein